MAEENLPVWFRMFEPIAVLIGLVALAYMYKTYSVFQKGLKSGYAYILGGTGLVVMSMVWKALVEAGAVAEGLAAEVILELFIIIGIVVIAYGSKVISDTIRKI